MKNIFPVIIGLLIVSSHCPSFTTLAFGYDSKVSEAQKKPGNSGKNLGANWKLVEDDGKGTRYYVNSKTISHPSKNVVRYEVRVVYAQTTEEALDEIDCSNLMWRRLKWLVTKDTPEGKKVHYLEFPDAPFQPGGNGFLKAVCNLGGL